MMKTPCPVPKSTGPSHVQGPIYRRGLFSKLHFPRAFLGGLAKFRFVFRGTRGVKAGRGSWTAQAAGGWLCPLLDKARLAEIFSD